MNYRKTLETTQELAAWYNTKYIEMGGTWVTPPKECNRHLDALGVPSDKSKWLLDVGCGGGHFLEQAQKRVETDGLEISRVALWYCQQLVRHSRTWLGDICGDDLTQRNHWRPSAFNYIVSIGSLEHVIDIDKALDNIRDLLRDDGRWYFVVPNEQWRHNDQPNERTATNAEWAALFAAHGLATLKIEPWNDQTAFMGCKGEPVTAQPPMTLGDNLCLNIGSGQRPFAKPWVNVDVQAKWHPDIVADGARLPMIADGQAQTVVLHHVLEHYGCGEASGLVQECHRMLTPGGSLLVFVPDVNALAKAYLGSEMDTQLYMTNMYGAYMGDEADRHRWGYDRQSLVAFLAGCAKWSRLRMFDWREIEGASLARDWWVLTIECVK